jgi:hypothetical protein
MTSKTRYFVLTAFGILALGLTTGLVASLVGLPVALSSRAAGPDDLSYVPTEAVAVAYANVQEVMASELRQRLRKLEPDTSDRDEFEAKTGVNIERDIDTVVAAMLPEAGTGRDDSRPLVVVRGRFDQVRIEGLAREHGAAIEDYQGVRVIAHAGDRQTMALGFVEPGAIAVGSVEAVRGAIDAKRGGRSVLSNTELMRLVGDLDASNAWVVGRFDAMAGRAGLPDGLQRQVPALSWFSAAGHLNGGITGTFKAEAKDDEAATNLRDLLRGVVAMAKLQSSEQPGMKAMVDSLQLGGEGKIVAVGFSVPAEMFDALEAMKPRRERRPAEIR